MIRSGCLSQHRDKTIPYYCRRIFAICALLLLVQSITACEAPVGKAPPTAEAVTQAVPLERVTFADLPGWQQDNTTAEAIPVILRSCKAQKDPLWRKPCDALRDVPANDHQKARKTIESLFRPWRVGSGESGLFTGYYEARLNGALQRSEKFNVPLWQRPDDLVSVNLGAFRPELKGQNIAGRVNKGKLVPYDDRAEITNGSLDGRSKPLVWVDDPVEAFFLEIQGSGRVFLPNGDSMLIGYDAQNGHAYTAIGRVLLAEGELDSPVSMGAIRAWLAKNPARAQEIMNRNRSVVFFRRLQDGPKGAQGVVITPERSVAVDPAFVPLGTLLWLDVKKPDKNYRRLVVAQDTGGAIKGQVRGDIFFGAGHDAEQRAGKLQAKGTWYLLLPAN